MRALRWWLVLVLAGCAEKLPESHVLPLVNADQNLSQQARVRGLKAAYLADLAPEAVLLEPTPTPARTHISAQADSSSQRTWTPEYAAISAAGDLGYTLGLVTITASDAPVRFGHYVAVWHKLQRRWQLVVMATNRHGPPLQVHHDLEFSPAVKRRSAATGAGATELRQLQASEQILLNAWAQHGSQALLAHATDDIRLVPPDTFPISGHGAIQAAFAGRSDRFTFTPTAGGIATSGDLGYTYGTMTRQTVATAATETGGYLRVWRKKSQGTWQVALELHTLASR